MTTEEFKKTSKVTYVSVFGFVNNNSNYDFIGYVEVPYTYDDFVKGVETLRDYCSLRTESIQLQLENGETVEQMDYVDASGELPQDYAQEDPSGDAASIMKTVPAESPEPVPQTDPVEVTYVLNKSSQRFHYPDCDSVTEMKAKSRQDVDWSREEVIAAGYQPCGSCSP